MEGIVERQRREVNPLGRREKASQTEDQYPRWSQGAKEADGVGIAHAEALRLEPADLRPGSYCQLSGLVARWAGSGGGQVKWKMWL